MIAAVSALMIFGLVLVQFGIHEHERAVRLGRVFGALSELVAMFVFGLSWFLQMKHRRGALIYSGLWVVFVVVVWWFG